MHIIPNVIQTLLCVIIFAVVVSYIIRGYEVGNREDTAGVSDESTTVVELLLCIAGEIVAVVLCVLFYPFGYVRGESLPATIRPGERPVILCHGFMHNRSAFFLLRYRLRRAGWHNVFTPNFGPPSKSVHDFSEQLSDMVTRACSGTGCDEVDLIGHSMGGLVIRCFMETSDGASHVRKAITLGTPHRGTKMAPLGLLSTARQFRPDSALITELRNREGSGMSGRITCIWSNLDNIILPPEYACLPEPSTSIMIRNLGHAALLFSGKVFEKLSRSLSESPAE